MTSPYRGLTPYTEADAAYFFGRTAEIATITANLEVARLTLFYGPSGVGKSSVLRAGVIHQLTQRAQATFAATGVAEQIPVYFNQWASDPLLGLSQTLAQAVAPYLPSPSPNQAGGGTDALGAGAISLLAQLQQWSEQTDSELLLVLDQFEEFFQYHTQLGSPAQSQPWAPTSFAAQLVQIINHSALRVHLLLSLREDTLARLDYFQGRIPFLLDNRLSIGHLDRAAGEEAVVKPLARFNQEQQSHYTIEPALVTAVLEQVGSGQVTLSRQGTGTRSVEESDGAPRPLAPIEAPYLQLVLTRLWQQEQRNGSPTLRLTTLNDQLGGAAIIVRNYLDDTLAALTPAGRALAARFFDRLVTPSGAKIALTLAELTHYAGAEPAAVAALLEQLQVRRLLRPTPAPSGVIQYEIFHDVLGPALLDWQARYQKAQEEAQRLAEEQAARVAAEEQARVAEERASLQTEARQQAQARAQAEAERAAAEARRLRQSRWALAGLSLLLLFLVVAIGFTVQARQNAESAQATAQAESTRAIANEQMAVAAQGRAQANEVAAETQAQAARRAEATALASEQNAQAEKARTETALRRALAENLAGQSQLLIRADKEPGDRALILARDAVLSDLTVNSDAALRFALSNARWLRTMPPADRRHQGAVYSVAFHPDGDRIVSGGADGTIRLWRTQGMVPLQLFFDHGDYVRSVAFSPDGQRIVSGSEDRTVRLWDAASGEQLRQLNGHGGWVYAVGFSPDGQRIVSGSDDSTVRLWDAASGEQLRQLEGHGGWVYAVAFSPDGQRIVLGGDDSTVRLWDAASGEQLSQLDGHGGTVWSVAFSPDGQRIVSGGDDRTVRLWDAASGEQLSQLDGHGGPVWSVAFSPDGQRIVSGSEDRTVRLWDGPEQLVLRALARTGRPAPILINDERQRFGIGEAIALPGQDLLKPLMVQAQALGLVEQGNALARTGAISEAVAHFETALALDPTLHLTPEPYARRVLSNTVQALLFAGRQAAQAGQLETALAKFTEAAALDVAALTAEVTDLAVAALVEQGRNLAQEGQLEEALAKFTEAAALDETLDVAALTAEVTDLAVAALVEQGRNLAQEGQLEEALAKFTEAAALDETLDVAALTAEAKRLAATAQLVQSLEQVRILADQGDFAASGARLRDLATQVPLLTVGVVVTATTALTPLWRFDGSSGQTVTLTMVDTEDDDFDPYLTLIKPTGELGAEDDDSGGGSDGYDARIADLLLPADGVYFVLAGRPDNDVLYALTLTVQEPTERQPLATPSPTATATRR
jgi:hypothetical protein